jgi:hypothetical protein
MRAGALRDWLEIWALHGNPWAAVKIDDIACEVRAPKGGGVQTSLRAPVVTQINCRVDSGVEAGQFLRTDARLWVVDAAIDGRYRGAISATELIGVDAIYTPVIGTPYTIKTFFAENAPHYDEGGAVGYDHIIDVPKLDLVAKPARGDTITTRGVAWSVAGQPDGGDDGAVVRLMVNK